MSKWRGVAAISASISVPWTTAVAGLVGFGAAMAPMPAQAARCGLQADGTYSCSMVATTQSYKYNLLGSCTGGNTTRPVMYQVPEGTPPQGGWPVVFFYHGLNPAAAPPPDGPTTFAPPDASSDLRHLTASIHELLDDPNNTGKKYAVVLPKAALQLVVLRFWDTNLPTGYNLSSDTCFLPALWSSIEGGDYGPSSQYNMDRRYAYGMSSGGYNTSRMAVSWNGNQVWKALAIHSASYANCLGPVCNVPATMPANHPPTKFYHASGDPVNPISTMYPYYDKLLAQGYVAEVKVNNEGHNLTADIVGPGGVKAWFDQY